MVNRRMGNRSITSLRSRRRQTTVSHSRAGLNTDSRNPCRTASRSNTDNDSSSAYDEGKKKLKTFKQDSDKLAAMKAVKKDKDVKEKYETFEQDRAKYERYMNDLA